MTRVKSLAFGIKVYANPYETPKQTAKSVYHREHRSKKNRKSIHQIGKVKLYRQKLAKLKEPLDTDY